MANKIEVIGLGDALNRLANLDRKVRKKLLRQYVNEATKLVLKDAKKLAPKSTAGNPNAGLYRKSLGRKIKSYQGGAVMVGLVGARGGFRYPEGVRTRGQKKGEVWYQDPVNIAHLVEKGTAHSAARPHLRPALENSKDRIKALALEIIGRGLEAAA
jgi:HK97 gp10 family phage protein